MLQVVAHININDIAEEEGKLIEDYNSFLTKDEEQKQYLLQIVNDYKNQYPNIPDSNKLTLHQYNFIIINYKFI